MLRNCWSERCESVELPSLALEFGMSILLGMLQFDAGGQTADFGGKVGMDHLKTIPDLISNE